MQETQEIRVRSLGWEDPLEKDTVATHSSILFFFFHSSILASSIPQIKEPGRLQSIGSQRIDVTE